MTGGTVFRRFHACPHVFDDFWPPKNKKLAEKRKCGGREAANSFEPIVRRWRGGAPPNFKFHHVFDVSSRTPIFLEKSTFPVVSKK